MPPSAMQRHASGAAGLGGLVHGGELRDADAGDHAGGADGARADADLDGVDAGVDDAPARPGGVATLPPMMSTPLNVGIGLQAANHVESQLGAHRWRCRPRARPRRLPSGRKHGCRRRPRKPMPAATTQTALLESLVASGYCSVLTKSLTVIRPVRWPFGVDHAAAFRPCAWPAGRARPPWRCWTDR